MERGTGTECTVQCSFDFVFVLRLSMQFVGIFIMSVSEIISLACICPATLRNHLSALESQK